MKLAPLLALVLAAAGGWFASRQWPAARVGAAGETKVLFYQSPMHPWVKSDRPGQCTVCGMDLVPVYEASPAQANVADDVVMLPPGSPHAIGVRTDLVAKRPLVRTLRVSGMIGEDESRHGVISATVEGRIDGLAMSCDGEKVTRRQPLATIFSRTLLGAANDYKLAQEQGGPAAEQAKRALERYGLVWEQIKAIPQRQPDDLYFGLLSPLTGTIVKTYVAEGQYVKEGDKLFEIADFTKMWFMFSAFEQDLPFLQLGQIVSLHTASLPGQVLKGRINFLTPNLDEATLSAKVRVVLENPDRRIKNRTFAEGTVELEAPEVLAVPRSAVLWPGATPRAYVEIQPGVYELHTLKLGRTGDEAWEVLEGLKEGERVVTSANLVIDGQAQLNRLAHP